jgi:putative tryptophan/tyrosine transport system substrate-binding protein
MRRREFIAGLGGAAAWPLTARAQQSKTAVIGFLSAYSVDSLYDREIIPEVRRGLSESGYFEGRNLAFEYRTAEGHLERLPALADNLVRLKVAVIIATPCSSVGGANRDEIDPNHICGWYRPGR